MDESGSAPRSGDERDPGAKFALGAVALVIVVSATALLGWVSGSPGAASLWLDSIPMAPNTALCFLALSASLMGSARPRARASALAYAGVVFTGFVALLALAPSAPVEAFVRNNVSGASGTFRGFPLAVMSPVTAVLFLATAGALGLRVAALSLSLSLTVSNAERLRQASAILATAVTVTGTVTLLGYAFGAPLFQSQGGLVIPLALPTGLSFMVLGAGAVAASGARVWPTSALVGSTIRARLLRAFLPITGAVVLVVAWLGIRIAVSQPGNPAIWAAALASISLSVVVFVVSGVSDRIAAVLEASERARGVALRRQAEAEHRADTILACADEGIIVLDPAGQITFANPAARALLGPGGELIGRMHGEILHAPARAEAGLSNGDLEAGQENCGVCDCLRTGKGFRANRAELRSLSARRFPAAYSSAPILKESLVTGSVLTFSDLTERQSLEHQLRQSQKMEAMGRLAGGVAHDFNNLLTAILGFNQFVASELEPEHPAQPDLREVQRAGERAASLTRQLLAFSRQQPEAPELLDLNAILADMEKMLCRLIGENIELVSMPDPNLARIRADRGHIEQVILNLVVNALDAMPKGGKLTLETGNVRLDGTYVRGQLGAKPGSYAMLAATDTGIGMDEATLSRIFDPFFTTKEAGKGTGLGLATVYGILKQNEADVLVYSTPGRGTTFKVYFPRNEREVEATPLTSQSMKLLKAGLETILLVEDEAAVRTVAVRALETAGFRVLAAATAAEALRFVKETPGPIHALVTDVAMPEMDGPELARRVVQVRPQILVAFMSGYTGGALTHHGVLTSNIAYIPKPFTPESFVLAVRALVDGTRARSLQAPCLVQQ